MKREKEKSFLPLCILSIHEDRTEKLNDINRLQFMKINFEDYVPPNKIKLSQKMHKLLG